MKTVLSIFGVAVFFAVTGLHAAEPTPAQAQATPAKVPKVYPKPTRTLVYKTAGGRELEMLIFEPKGFQAAEKRPCVLAIHGGGWKGGKAETTNVIAEYFAAKGMVGISLEYRLYDPTKGVTVEDCVKDARSAMRYLRTHAAELGIDADKITVCGVSAGGHLAAGTAVFTGIDEAGEDVSVGTKPAALVLFCPVLDTSTDGYGNEKAGANWRDISVLLRMGAGFPPTIVYHPKTDKVVPYKGTAAFVEAMKGAGNAVEFVSYDEGAHCFMNHDPVALKGCLDQAVAFLQPLGLMGDGGR